MEPTDLIGLSGFQKDFERNSKPKGSVQSSNRTGNSSSGFIPKNEFGYCRNTAQTFRCWAFNAKISKYILDIKPWWDAYTPWSYH